tara:strand:- start:57 stop:344 length:288 start_codon:yes stop_codon:yes gene_type:complete
MNNKELIENTNNVAKAVKSLVKDNKELTDLVCYMRKLLDNCLLQTNDGDLVEMTNDDKKLSRAFEIMMLVQHEKDIAKEKKAALANGQQTIGDFE